MPTINDYRIELARLVEKCSKDWAVHHSHLASAKRLLAEPVEKPAPGAGSWTPPEVFLTERDQYGVKVFHPDCAITRSVCEVLGTKTMPWRGIDHLKRIGHTVTVRGTGGRPL